MLRVHLAAAEAAAIEAVCDELAQRYDTVESAEFQQESRVYAEELPRRIRSALHDFRSSERSAAFVLSGFPVPDDKIGPTPRHWADKPVPSPTLRQDIAFFLIASVLGEPIGWATQQDGYIMHDVFPIKGHEHEQIGFGSAELLTWHTEDAFHPLRTDYLGLMCLRNPDKVETTLADVADVKIDDATRRILTQERFYILPDNSHRQREGEEVDNTEAVPADDRVAALRRRSRRQVERALSAPEPVAVLFGDAESPYLRIDPYYMADAQGDEEQAALDTVGEAIDAAMTGVTLEPGDICLIDNYRAVHGRKPFRARFDGTDRWLRRLNVTRDLRKSRGSRLDARSRVIY